MHNLGYVRGAQGRRAMAVLLVGLLAAGSLGGCAQLARLKGRMAGHDTAAPATPARAPEAPPTRVEEPAPASLSAIVNQQLQLGHYAEGERQLRRFLEAHPDDRAAQAMLRQLTVDPEQALGHASQEYVVRPGDSYSTLAARYLGDGSRFLILARYNGSANPAQLRVGQKLRLPASRLASSAGAEGDAAVPQAAAAADASGEAKARRLQDESLALLRKGERTQALERMDEALDADPRLPAGDADAKALRQQLVSVYHQRAIVLYRDQQLDQAISLWDRVLAIEPDFEPATVYRARALELKQRLKQF